MQSRWAWLAVGIAVLVAIELRVSPSGHAPADESVSLQPPETDTQELTKPEDLLLSEQPDRADWQKPEQVMDELRIADGDAVADIGAGSGWFTIRLAERVRERGVVYAQDVQAGMLAAITRRVGREGYRNVQVVQGDGNTTRLPLNALDAVLVVDVYGEIDDPVSFLRGLTESLKPHGRIGIVNYKPGQGGPGPARRIAQSVVEKNAGAAGLKVVSTMDLRYQYLVVLARAGEREPAATTKAATGAG